MITVKTIALTIRTFVGQVMSLIFNTLSRFVIAFLPRSKCLLTSWLPSPSSDFGAQENEICHCFHFFPIHLPWSDGTGCHDLSFLNAEFQASFFHFPLSPSLRGSVVSLHFVIRVISSAYLRLLILLPAILIPACDSSSLAFHMIHSAYKLKKQGDNIQPWHTPFLILKQVLGSPKSSLRLTISQCVCSVVSVSLWPHHRSQSGSSVLGILQARILSELPFPSPGLDGWEKIPKWAQSGWVGVSRTCERGTSR